MRKFVSKIKINGSLDKNAYYSRIPAVKHIKEHGLEFESNISFFVGENGMGKSTLIEAIAASVGFNPEGGDMNHRFSTKETHSSLYESITVVRQEHAFHGFFMRAESFYNVVSFLQENGGGKYTMTCHNQSHGQSVLEVVSSFVPNGLYILDEPESALSAAKLFELMTLIYELSKKNCQFIIATHSPLMVTMPHSEIFRLDGDGIEKIKYEDYEGFQLTKRYLEATEKMKNYLFGE